MTSTGTTGRGGTPARFDLQPTLKGNLLTLRPMRPEDFDALFEAAKDPLIWEQHPDRERYTEPRFRVYFQGGLDSGGAFLVIDNETGRVIGSTRYCGYAPERSEIEIGWTFLERKYWGGRHNGEMKRLMLEHAFRFVDHVVFLIGEDNWRSRRAVEKIGGVRIEDRIDSKGEPRVVYRISAAAYTGGRKAS
ncbi:MAG TPA: GNAT family N-acetyltransferase [Candidatus Eisenbacteria bacterium]|nr:GNAT family N-acetyltransferase [Candidatus Eisenbacteria bacterium]